MNDSEYNLECKIGAKAVQYHKKIAENSNKHRLRMLNYLKHNFESMKYNVESDRFMYIIQFFIFS